MRTRLAVTAVLVSLAAVGLAAGPASAAGPGAADGARPAPAGTVEPNVATASIESCIVGRSACSTYAVSATSAGKVSYEIYTTILGCRYRIRDTWNGVVVRSGTAWRVEIGSVSGLNHSYRLELWDCFPTDTGLIFGA